MAKGIDREFRGKSGVLPPLSRKVKTAKGLSRNDLCALCLLSIQPVVFILEGSKDKEEGQ